MQRDKYRMFAKECVISWAFGPGFLGCSLSPPLVPARDFHTKCKIWLHIYRHIFALAVFYKVFSDFYMFKCKTDCSTHFFYF